MQHRFKEGVCLQMLNYVRAGVAAAAIVLLASPAAIGGASAGPEGKSWSLVEVEGRSASLPSGQKQPGLMLDADQTKAAGFAGCNSFSGSYALSGAGLRFGSMTSTRMACPDKESGIESAFLDALSRTRAWRIEPPALLLLGDGGVLARLVSADAGRPDLNSATLQMTSLPSGSVTLSRGQYRSPAAPGSAEEIIVTLTDKQAFGKVKGKETGAAVLVASQGGTGSFYELALLVKDTTGWNNTDTVLLGDRVLVRDLSIEDARIVVSILEHGPEDALCCPTRETTKRFKVRNDRLVEEDE